VLIAPYPAPAQWPTTSQQQQQIQWPTPPAQPQQQQQQQQPKQPPKQPQQQDVEELTPGQIRRAQEAAEPPPTPKRPKAVSRPKPKPKPRPSVARPNGRAVSCGGAFAKNSNHVRLAQAFGSENIIHTEIEGAENTRLQASVLFPRDPRQRLEVVWENDAARTNTFLIVIKGNSAWTAPRGLHLGMPLDEIEKLNGRAFKLRGFAEDGSMVLDWQGGALATLPGGCKVSLRLVAHANAPEAARQRVAGRKELVSNDASVRALRPAVAEILLGY
jgi:hypothetical protein